MLPIQSTGEAGARAAAMADPSARPGFGAGEQVSRGTGQRQQQPPAFLLSEMSAERRGHFEHALSHLKKLPRATRIVSALDSSMRQQGAVGGNVNVVGSDDDGRHEEIGLSEMAFHFEDELNVPLCMFCSNSAQLFAVCAMRGYPFHNDPAPIWHRFTFLSLPPPQSAARAPIDLPTC